MNYLIILIFAASLGTGERQTFLKKELAKRGFEPTEVTALLSDERLAKPPGKATFERITWAELRKRVLSEESIRRGKEFLTANEETFNCIESQFGIPKEIQIAMLRVETDLGQFTGETEIYKFFYHRMITVKKRKAWRSAAVNFAVLAAYCKITGKDPFELRGSHAGAWGLTQLLPQNLEKFGYDANCDGVIDLMSLPDALASSANFLNGNHWRRSKTKALACYYGSPRYYPEVVLSYAEKIKIASKPTELTRKTDPK